MQFRISKASNGSSTQWAIIPTSGKFEDKVVAVADLDEGARAGDFAGRAVEA